MTADSAMTQIRLLWQQYEPIYRKDMEGVVEMIPPAYEYIQAVAEVVREFNKSLLEDKP